MALARCPHTRLGCLKLPIEREFVSMPRAVGPDNTTWSRMVYSNLQTSERAWVFDDLALVVFQYVHYKYKGIRREMYVHPNNMLFPAYIRSDGILTTPMSIE